MGGDRHSWSKALGAVVVAAALCTIAVPVRAVTITEFSTGGDPNIITNGPDGALWFTEYNANKVGRMTTTGGLMEFPVPTSGSGPYGIVTGPDGALWFTESISNQIGRLQNGIAEFSIPTANSNPIAITAGPDGALWFTEFNAGKIGRITTGGAVTEFSLPTFGSSPADIRTGPDGALWFTDLSNNRIGRITTAGGITNFPIPTANSNPIGITAGPDGALWFTESAANKIGRITTAGAITEFLIPTANSFPVSIAAGSDGALWFTEYFSGKIGRITTGGVITEFSIPTANSGPYGITAGPDGALWFTEANANKIGRASVDVSTIVAAVLPLSRSVRAGGPAATAFAAIINAGVATAVNCAPAPPSNPPANLGAFTYQTTTPANALSGTPNTPVNIAPGAIQNYVFGFSPTGVIAETSLAMRFVCANVVDAPQTSGVNTLFIVADTSPVPDTIALMSTISGDGVVRIASSSTTQLFAIGTSNVGATGTIVVSGDTGAVALPMTLMVCETTGGSVCLSPPTPTITVNYLAGTNRSFAFFAQASGSMAFNPASNRVFARLRQSGVLRGATSAAVCTMPNSGC